MGRMDTPLTFLERGAGGRALPLAIGTPCAAFMAGQSRRETGIKEMAEGPPSCASLPSAQGDELGSLKP